MVGSGVEVVHILCELIRTTGKIICVKRLETVFCFKFYIDPSYYHEQIFLR